MVYTVDRGAQIELKWERVSSPWLEAVKKVLEDLGPTDKAGAWLASGMNAAATDAALALAPTLALADALADASVGRGNNVRCFSSTASALVEGGHPD